MCSVRSRHPMPRLGEAQIQAKGLRLGTPVVPFHVDSSTAMQVISLETDACWGATFSDTWNNRFERYKAKSD
jgi:hypothetical protein